MSHNKTLARQLYQEMAGLFPKMGLNISCLTMTIISFEAYAKEDLYIDKELSINERIEQERFTAVASLVSRLIA